ncbi:hypothetical protein CK203_003420 [Vitis vinifera]|uniref:Uncharacterized protein n=1 Tax=Vitis vinifera TaxID=29760 RepID=A0A438K6Z8_VITVI|nr:hypothetical protein CK203_003420 [Vitis vinifera]
MKRKLKKLSGYANDNVKIWVIQNEIRDCIDENEMTMEGENEEDEKIEIHPNKDVIKRDLNGKNEDACATSIEVHIIPNKNVDILPIPIKRTRKDYGKEPLQALCGIPEHVMKTRTSKERKPRKFKIFPFVHNLRKMGKCQVLESIPMSIREDVVGAQSFNVLQSLVADCVFNKSLSKVSFLLILIMNMEYVEILSAYVLDKIC